MRKDGEDRGTTLRFPGSREPGLDGWPVASLTDGHGRLPDELITLCFPRLLLQLPVGYRQ